MRLISGRLVISVIISLVLFFLFVFDYVSKSKATMKIIGGADGPTVIFLSSNPIEVFMTMVGIVAVIYIVFSLVKRILKKKTMI